MCIRDSFMCETALLDVLAKLALHGNFMLLAGDDAQLPPIEILGDVPPLLDSDLLKCLAPRRIELVVCKRSDARLHDFNVLCRSETLEAMMAHARSAVQCKGDPDISLCADNARRKQINEETNRRRAPRARSFWRARTAPYCCTRARHWWVAASITAC